MNPRLQDEEEIVQVVQVEGDEQVNQQHLTVPDEVLRSLCIDVYVHVLRATAGLKCDYVTVAEEDYLRDGLNKTDAIISSLDLNQALAEVIPVVFSLAKKGCLLFLVKLRNTAHTYLNEDCTFITKVCNC